MTTDGVRYVANERNDSAPPPHAGERHAIQFADLVERVSPVVVSVTADRPKGLRPGRHGHIPDPFREFFRQFNHGRGMPQVQPEVRRAVSMGSGFIIDKSGLS